jgi:poly(3-hydroxybutyrate) depolymerase
VSVSGLSSGAFFAVQYQIAFSASVKGAAIFAGGPYYCAQSELTDAFLMCMDGLESIPLSSLEAYASQQARNGDIDSLGNLTSQNVFLFSGSLDTTVSPVVMHSLEQMYKDFGVTNVKSNFGLTAAHTFPTLTYGNLCTLSYLPYISACNYDGAGIAFQTIYGDLKPPVSPVSSNILSYNQADYTSVSPSSISLASTGYAYIPTACKTPSDTICKIHVAFHGCLQYAGVAGMAFVQNAGYNNWAESNNIIVLYPQTTNSLFLPSNPNGCWDWWGYTVSSYTVKSAPQMAFTQKLINFFIQNY